MRARHGVAIGVPVLFSLFLGYGLVGGYSQLSNPSQLNSEPANILPFDYAAYQLASGQLAAANWQINPAKLVTEQLVTFEPVIETIGIVVAAAPSDIVANIQSIDPQELSEITTETTDLSDPLELTVFDDTGAATAVIEPEFLFQTVAATWPVDAEAPKLQIRVQDVAGEWGDWYELVDDGAGPDEGQQDMAEVRAGSDTLAFADSAAVQVATIGAADLAEVGAGVEIALIGIGEPNLAAPDKELAISGKYSNAILEPIPITIENASSVINKPNIITRDQWGANEPRCDSWGTADALQFAVVHHTAGSNGYATQSAAAQQIRNDQRYHQIGRGWCDLGYNFVVDRFGNIYEGAAGSIDRALIGAHTAGFNTGSVGVSMLGDYTSLTPPGIMVDAVARIIAWRLAAYSVPANGQTTLYAGAGNTKKWPAGTPISSPVITAHRNIGATTCPGDAGYRQMDTIRMRAVGQQANMINHPPRGVVDSITTPQVGQIKLAGWAFDPDTSGAINIQVYVGAKLAKTTKAGSSRPDVQTAYGLVNANHGFDLTLTNQPLGPQKVCVFAVNSPSGANVNIGCKNLLLFEKVDFAGKQVTRFAGSTREDTARVVAHSFTPSADTVFIATGADYPDALAAAAAAKQAKAPLLLYGTDAENAKTLAYLKGLGSGLKKIFVFGGEKAVPDAFVASLKKIALVERIAGDDRYETAAKTAARFFPTANAAFIVTGADFPDALAAAVAAGDIGAPVLLVGSDFAASAAAADVLATLKPTNIYIAGGEKVVSAEVAKSLSQFGKVERVSGDNRYETAAAIAAKFFPSVDTAFIATGFNFPDALAGAAAGAQLGVPVLLSNPWQLGAQPKTYLTGSKELTKIYLLGGESVLFPEAYPAK